MLSKTRMNLGLIVAIGIALLQSAAVVAEPPGSMPKKDSGKMKVAAADEPAPAKPAETKAQPTAETKSESPTPTSAASTDPQVMNLDTPPSDRHLELAADGINESQPEQGAVPMEDINLGEPVLTKGKDRPFFSDATLKLQLRTYYFDRDKYDDSGSEAWAVGGALAFKSGYIADRFGVGAVLYTSQPLYAPEYRDGSGLLRSDQVGYVSLGQAYGEVKIVDGLQMNFGRKEYNTPFVNAHDVRMTPKTFQGVTFTGTHKGKQEGSNWRYGAGYLYKMKDWTDTEFDWTSEALGVDRERGIAMLGGNYSTKAWSVGAIDYYSPDLLNIFYSEGSYGWKTSDNTSVKLSGQFVDQQSVGAELITDEEFAVSQWGVKADFGIHAATITLGFTDVTGGNTNVRSPWGGYPGYTSVQVKDFNRADESAFLLKAAYDFTKQGLPGFSAYALLVHGMGVSAPNTFNEDEYDFNLQWAPKEGKMKDFSARLRYARINQRGGGDPSIDDFRIILNYTFNILK